MDAVLKRSRKTDRKHPFPFSKDVILQDYSIAQRSRMISITARQEVFSGKAKFGIFGDGKEVAQIAPSRITAIERCSNSG